MSNLPAVEATKRAVHDTRTRVLLSKTKMTSPAAITPEILRKLVEGLR